MKQDEIRLALLATIPDEPQLIDTRAVLLEDPQLFGTVDGCVAVRSGGWLLVAIGSPGREMFEAALGRARPDAALVATGPAIEAARRHLTAEGELAVVHALGARGVVRDLDTPAAVLLEPGAPLGDLSAETQREIGEVRLRELPIGAVLEEGLPVSICYPIVMTESYWDVSIETVDGYRRTGRAAAAFLRVESEMAERGHAPVWGAVESNAASLALAAKLGFEPVGQIAVFELGLPTRS